jgi:hypothetical protein
VPRSSHPPSLDHSNHTWRRVHEAPHYAVFSRGLLRIFVTSWGTTPCRLSPTIYSIYSQLRSIPGERLLHPQPEDAPCRVDKGPTLIFQASCKRRLKVTRSGASA